MRPTAPVTTNFTLPDETADHRSAPPVNKDLTTRGSRLRLSSGWGFRNQNHPHMPLSGRDA